MWIRSNIAVFVLLIIISSVVYFNSLDNGFHFDDRDHILNNRYLRSLKNIPLFFVDINTFSGTPGNEHYRPIILISHAINYYLSGLDPVGYHIVNLLLHVGTAFLVFLILKAMMVTPTLSLPQYPIMGEEGKVEVEVEVEGKGRKGYYIAISAALIFAVHPFNSEVVNYITARSSVMCAFFYLLAFYFWIRFRKAAGGGSQSSTTYYLLPTTYFYIASLLSFLLAMLTKEIAITLPIMLLLYDSYFTSLDNRERSLKSFFSLSYMRQLALYIPYILLVAVPYITLRTYFAGSVVSSKELPRGYYHNLLMETKVLVRYLYLLFFPAKLSVEHAVLEVSSIWDWNVLCSIALLMVVIGFGIFLYRSKDPDWRVVSFFILWFFITMLPTTIVPFNAPLQENRGYLAGAGVAIFLGVAINRFACWSNYGGILKKSILILILLLYSVGTIDRNAVWEDDFILWTDAVEKSPLSWRAHGNLAAYYVTIGLENLAIDEYKKAIEIKKDDYKSMNYLGAIYLKDGKLDLALAEFEKAVSIRPTYIEAHMNIARVHVKLGHLDIAMRECETVVELGELLNKEDDTVAEARRYLKWFRARAR